MFLSYMIHAVLWSALPLGAPHPLAPPQLGQIKMKAGDVVRHVICDNRSTNCATLCSCLSKMFLQSWRISSMSVCFRDIQDNTERGHLRRKRHKSATSTTGKSASTMSMSVTSWNPWSITFASGIKTQTLSSALPFRTFTSAELGYRVLNPRTSGTYAMSNTNTQGESSISNAYGVFHWICTWTRKSIPFLPASGWLFSLSPSRPRNNPAGQFDRYHQQRAPNVTTSQCRISALVCNHKTNSNLTRPGDRLELHGSVTRSPAGLQLIPAKCTQSRYIQSSHSGRTRRCIHTLQ